MKNITIILLLLSTLLYAVEKPIEKRSYSATRVSGKVPVIDGILNEECWEKSEFQTDFTQIDPVEGASPSEPTQFSIIYNDDYLYFGIINYDSRPDSIEVRVARRDDIMLSDFIFITFDSYNDKRTAFGFGVNAAGVREDIFFSENGNIMDVNWDPVWETKCTITDSGWTAEGRIPFSQLRFSDKKEQVWGLNLFRNIYRKKEGLLWQYVAKDNAGFISEAGILKGISDIPQPKRLELMPYALGKYNSYEVEKGNPFKDGSDFSFNGGLDGKFGLTSNLTLDFTINPDFGQVEADPSEVNLSAYESYFEERRPFFIEGKNIFRFNLAPGDGDMSMEKLFYSRRIGSRPHYYPSSDDGFYADYVDMPDYTRILGAAKLSGKTKGGLSVGILDAVTNKEIALLDEDGQRSEVTVEPLTNFFVTRFQQDYDEGNTSLGGMITAVNRKIDDRHLDYLNKSSYSGGVDFRHQWDDKTYALNFRLAGSHIIGEKEAIIRLQESSARYYQRPDADYVELDSSRTTLSGYAGHFSVGKFSKDQWRYSIGGAWRSPGLELNDVGFLRQADQAIQYVWIGYHQLNPQGIFRSYRININQYNGWNFGGDRIYTGGNINGGAQFVNYWTFNASISRMLSGLSGNLLRGGPMARYMGQTNLRMYIGSDERKDLVVRLNVNRSFSDDDISNGYRTTLNLRYKISSRLNVSVQPFYNYNIENLQYIATEDYQDENRYIFGQITQNTTGMYLRINYSPTPDLSIQFFGQPFIASGKYGKFKHIDNPRGEDTDRYHQYTEDEISYDENSDTFYIDENGDGVSDYSFDNSDYNYKEFLSNLVIRWEYRPGSTLYLVWSQTKNNFDDPGQFSIQDDLKNLFDSAANNVFLVKMNYWFSF